MAQVYKMMLGTSGKQWEQLTVSEDGTMMLYFHGTDRSVTQRVTLIEDGAWKGWLRSENGSLWPGIASGRWQAMDCPAESAEIAESAADAVVVVTNTDCTDDTDKPITINPDCNATLSKREPLTVIATPHSQRENQAKPARPRRQRKARKPAVDFQPSAISHQPSKNDHALLRLLGYLAAASVALLVIWQTGLMIPLGLIGLATSGFLK